MTITSWIKSFILALLVFFGLSAQFGCGINTSLTEQQQDKDLATKMAWVDKAIELAESHGLAYRIEVNASGRPSIGETVDLYLDTGIDARIIMFGNGAAGRMAGPKAKLESVDTVTGGGR